MTYGVQSFHSDYMSGWDEAELQRLLDTCENESEAASPTAFCSDHLTYRGKGKTEGVQVETTSQKQYWHDNMTSEQR